MHIPVAFDRFQKPLKNTSKKLQNSCFERGHVAFERGPDNERNVATNIDGTWPTTQRNVTTNVFTNMAKRFIGHVVNVAREPFHVVGHVPATFNIAET